MQTTILVSIIIMLYLMGMRLVYESQHFDILKPSNLNYIRMYIVLIFWVPLFIWTCISIIGSYIDDFLTEQEQHIKEEK